MWPVRDPFACCRLSVRNGAIVRPTARCISRAHLRHSGYPSRKPRLHGTNSRRRSDTRPTTSTPTGTSGRSRWARSASSTAISAPARCTPCARRCTAIEQGTAGADAVLGVLSLMVWTLMLIVTLKYVLVLLNADNKGEGGTFALMALGQSVAKRSASPDPDAGRGGAAFFYGDAVITPAISVLSAVEGLKLVAPQLGDDGVAVTARHPRAAVRRAVARNGEGRAVFRAGHARVVRRARRRRARSTSSTIRASFSPSTRCSASSSS